MKRKLIYLKNNNDKYFSVILDLWLKSDDYGNLEVSKEKLMILFNCSAPTFNSLYEKYILEYVTSERIEKRKRIFSLNFESLEIENNNQNQKQKTKLNKKESLIDKELKDFLKDFYIKNDYDYPDLEKHYRFAELIYTKLVDAMKKREGVEITDVTKKDTFFFFFNNLPNWWVENRNISLTVINKNFTKILNQIKTTRKDDKYSKTAIESESIDFSQFTG